MFQDMGVCVPDNYSSVHPSARKIQYEQISFEISPKQMWARQFSLVRLFAQKKTNQNSTKTVKVFQKELQTFIIYDVYTYEAYHIYIYLAYISSPFAALKFRPTTRKGLVPHNDEPYQQHPFDGDGAGSADDDENVGTHQRHISIPAAVVVARRNICLKPSSSSTSSICESQDSPSRTYQFLLYWYVVGIFTFTFVYPSVDIIQTYILAIAVISLH